MEIDPSPLWAGFDCARNERKRDLARNLILSILMPPTAQGSSFSIARLPVSAAILSSPSVLPACSPRPLSSSVGVWPSCTLRPPRNERDKGRESRERKAGDGRNLEIDTHTTTLTAFGLAFGTDMTGRILAGILYKRRGFILAQQPCLSLTSTPSRVSVLTSVLSISHPTLQSLPRHVHLTTRP